VVVKNQYKIKIFIKKFYVFDSGISNDLLASNHKLLGKSFVCPVPLGSALMRKESE